MTSWSRYDTAEERLPDGMISVAYDADTEIYTYCDSDGGMWESPRGCRYGHLARVCPDAPTLPSIWLPTDVDYPEPDLLDDYSEGDEAAPSHRIEAPSRETSTLSRPTDADGADNHHDNKVSDSRKSFIPRKADDIPRGVPRSTVLSKLYSFLRVSPSASRKSKGNEHEHEGPRREVSG
ncbi:Ff.00g086040.m01.CDS01 [Fusarium sp. VM40]|nr:Ff.00g086040.m01.CDS01 [Fusarium sp. VM40]